MEGLLSCQICLEQYDGGSHTPILIPTCGHSVCRLCISTFRKAECPNCRVAFEQDMSTFPINQQKLDTVRRFKEQANVMPIPYPDDQAPPSEIKIGLVPCDIHQGYFK